MWNGKLEIVIFIHREASRIDSKVNQDVGIICVHFSRANLFEYKVEMEFLIAEYKMI